MTLDELIRREKELREKYGDDWYEKTYLHEKQFECTYKRPAQTNDYSSNTDQGKQRGWLTPPSFKTTPFKPTIGNGVSAPKLNIPILKRPATVNAPQKSENLFYANKADSGTISLPPKKPTSIEDFRNGIEELSNKLKSRRGPQKSKAFWGGRNSNITICFTETTTR